MRIKMRPMSADDELAVQREYPALLPGLLGRGLAHADAVALAHNAAFLFRALDAAPPLEGPEDVLARFSLGQIARLCEEYEAARGELEQLAPRRPGRRGRDELSG